MDRELQNCQHKQQSASGMPAKYGCTHDTQHPRGRDSDVSLVHGGMAGIWKGDVVRLVAPAWGLPGFIPLIEADAEEYRQPKKECGKEIRCSVAGREPGQPWWFAAMLASPSQVVRFELGSAK